MDLRGLIGRLANADFADAVGLAFTGDRAAVAHLRKRFHTVKVVTVSSQELDGVAEARRSAVADLLRGFLAGRSLEGARFGVAVPRSECFIGQLQLPSTASNNVGQVVSYEMDRIVPVPPESVYSDCYFRELGTGGERIGVTIVAAAKENIESLHEWFADAGLAPSSVLAQPAALNDYYYFCRRDEPGVAGLFHADGERSAMTLSCDGLMVSSIHVEQSEGRDHSDALYREIERSVPDKTDDVADVVVDLGPTLASLAPPGFLPDGLEPDWLECTAIGAALGQLGEARRRLNLLPRELIRGEEGMGMREISLSALVLAAAVVLAVSIGVKNMGTANALEVQLKRMTPRVAMVTGREQENRELLDRVMLLEGQRRKKILPYLRNVTDLVPKSAYLTTFRFKGDRVEMDGIADNASELISILERSPYFRNVEFTAPTTKYLQNQERFSLRMGLEK